MLLRCPRGSLLLAVRGSRGGSAVPGASLPALIGPRSPASLGGGGGSAHLAASLPPHEAASCHPGEGPGPRPWEGAPLWGEGPGLRPWEGAPLSGISQIVGTPTAPSRERAGRSAVSSLLFLLEGSGLPSLTAAAQSLWEGGLHTAKPPGLLPSGLPGGGVCSAFLSTSGLTRCQTPARAQGVRAHRPARAPPPGAVRPRGPVGGVASRLELRVSCRAAMTVGAASVPPAAPAAPAPGVGKGRPPGAHQDPLLQTGGRGRGGGLCAVHSRAGGALQHGEGGDPKLRVKRSPGGSPAGDLASRIFRVTP